MKHFNYYASPASINSAMEIRIASWNWKRPIQDYQKEANGFLKEHGIIYDNPDKFLLNPMVSKTDKLSAAFYCVCKGNADCIEFLVKEMLCNRHKKLRRLAGELLAKLAWADYPMSRIDNNFFRPHSICFSAIFTWVYSVIQTTEWLVWRPICTLMLRTTMAAT